MFTVSLFILLFLAILKFGISNRANLADKKVVSEIGVQINIHTAENSI
jgi:hypothetical protein